MIFVAWFGCSLCHVLLLRLRKITFELVEAAGPALRVAVACGLVKELLVDESEERACALGFDEDGHKRLALGHGTPRPGEHEFLVGHDLAVDAADVMLLAVLGMELYGIAPTNAHISRSLLHRPRVRAEPLHYFFGLGPGRIDFFRRRVETTFESETGPWGDGGLD